MRKSAILHLIGTLSGFLLAMPTGVAQPVTAEADVNLPGADIRSIELRRSDDVSACRRLCVEEDACRAYSFVRAGVQGRRPRCWLKRSVPQPTRSDCCISGVRMTRESNTDRPGADIRSESSVTHLRCEQLCLDDANCRAYTWVPQRRRRRVRRGRCHLKSSIAEAQVGQGMISGTKPLLQPAAQPRPQRPARRPPQPEALGCFVDRAQRDLPDVVPGDRHTPDRCLTTCRARGQAYAAVQYGGHCFCGQSYGRYGAAARSECAMPCRGRAGWQCGGGWRNLVMATGVAAPGEAAEPVREPDPPTPQQIAGGHESAAAPPPVNALQAAMAAMRSTGPDGAEVVGLDAILRAHEVNGAAVVLIEDGAVGETSYHGYRDRRRRHRVDAATRFDMASTTKLVAALATVRASREGRAPPLDLSLRAYLDQRSPRKLSRWARRTFRRKKGRLHGITLRRLLNHTAGLSNHGIGINTRDRRTSVRRVLRDTDTQAEPGTTYDYSGGGYTVAELMVGGWGGPSARDVLEDFLRFMGMRQSTFTHADRVQRFAETCSRGSCSREAHTEVKFAGGLVATPEDYARVLIALLGRGPLPEADIRDVLQPGQIRAGTLEEGQTQTSYGLGVQLSGRMGGEGEDGLARCLNHGGSHPGSNRGAQTWFFLDRSWESGVVVVLNGASEWTHRGATFGSKKVRALVIEALNGLPDVRIGTAGGGCKGGSRR